MKCIYCGVEIKKPSKEHIIPNCFGCSKTNREIVCEVCNSEMGHTFEAVFCEQFNQFRVLFGILSGDGKEAPPIKGMKDENGKVYNLEHGAKPVLSKPEVIKLKDDDLHIMRAKYRSWEEGEKHLRGFLKNGDKKVELEYTSDYLEKPITGNIAIGGADTHRGAAKIAFNYFAHLFGGEIALNTKFNDIRNYIRYGVKPPFDCINIDLFPIPHCAPELGLIDHSVAIFNKHQSLPVWGVVRLYGVFTFTCVLAERNDIFKHNWGKIYAFDPIIKNEYESDFVPICEPYLPQVARDIYKRKRDRYLKMYECNMNILLDRFVRYEKDCQIGKIAEMSIKKVLGEPNGREITKDDIRKLAKEVSERYVKSEFKIPTTQKFTIRSEDDINKVKKKIDEDK